MNAIRASLAPFLIVSSAFHLLLALSWYARYDGQPVRENIPVTVLPPPPEEKPAAPQASREAPARSRQPPAQIAKKSPRVAKAPQEPDKTPSKLAEKDKITEEPPALKPRRAENETIVQRPLPTLKDLLPPVYSAYSEASRGTRGTIPLNSQDPRYVSYLTSVKQAIEIVWIYPEIAKRHRLRGKVLIEFAILANGQLEGIQMIRSSGSSVLDEEAVRALRAAAPFRALPAQIGTRMPISASFEYVDDRLKYSFAP
ncbi:MAG: energy transducer TonB [Candidatus Binatia bacterium]